MNRRSTKLPITSHLQSESGIYFIFCGAFIVSLFAIVALAVDGGNILRSKLEFQRAIDAAATSGMLLLRERTPDRLEEMTRGLALENLALMGLDVAVSVIDVDVNDESTKITVVGELELPYFFRFFPGLGSSLTFQAGAIGETGAPIAAFLVLDRTGSMGLVWSCPPDDHGTPHICDGEWAYGAYDDHIDGWCPRICALKLAVEEFVDEFPTDYDLQLGALAYNSSFPPLELKAIETPWNDENREALIEDVWNLTPRGSTGLSGGLYAARTEILDFLEHHEVSHTHVILFTDGVPNVNSAENEDGTDTFTLGCFRHDGDERGDIGFYSVQASDWLRAIPNLTVHTLGLGTTARNRAALLRRIANAEIPEDRTDIEFTQEITPPDDCDESVDGDCACVERAGDYYKRGNFMNATEPEDLPGMFQAIADAIKASRLTY